LMERFAENPASPPSIKDVNGVVGPELYSAMIDMGYLVPLSAEVVFRREDYDTYVEQIVQMLQSEGTISVAQVRDSFQTSRKYVLAILEHLDATGLTIRDGNSRRLRTIN